MTETYVDLENGYVLSHESESAKYRLYDTGGKRNVLDGYSYLSWEDMRALSSFFQREWDGRLGRWRSAKYPEMVVYPEGDAVLVLNEVGGMLTRISRETARGSAPSHLRDEAIVAWNVAREYYEAHPHPWTAAKPGEVWELTLNRIDDSIVTVRAIATPKGFITDEGGEFDFDSICITTARLLLEAE